MNKILTSYIFPPIPSRHWDWCAYVDGEENICEFGYTEKEAIENLKEMLDESI